MNLTRVEVSKLRPEIPAPVRVAGAVCGLTGVEMRRNGGWLLVPAAFLIVGWMTWQGKRPGLVLWPDTMLSLGTSIQTLGPLLAALACWHAGRRARRGLDDLTATTAMPPGWPVLVTWFGLSLWAVLGYSLAVAAAFGWTAWGATWGGPDTAPLLVAVATLPVCAAIGVLAGTLSSSRLLPPIVALVTVGFLLGSQALARVGITFMAFSSSLYTWTFLSPVSMIGLLTPYEFSASDPSLVAPALRWLLAIGATLLAAAVAVRSRSRATRLLLVLGVVAAIFAGGQIGRMSMGRLSGTARVAPYTPVCRTETVTVCVHPAYRALLNEASDQINGVVRPVRGFSAVPATFAQSFGEASGGAYDPEAITFSLYSADVLAHGGMAMRLASDLVRDMRDGPGRYGPDLGAYYLNDAQCVVATWLVTQARVGGKDANCIASGGADIDAGAREAAYARFAALDPATRSAWLAANWDDLRAWQLTLDDLPSQI